MQVLTRSPVTIGRLLWSPTATRAQSPHLAATLAHEERSVGADGVVRMSKYRERFLRDPEHVWVERLPAPVRPRPAGISRLADGPARATARLVLRGEGGAASLALVCIDEHLVLDVDAEDFAAFSFDGRFSTSYHLVEPGELLRMRPGRVTAQGRWYSMDTDEMSVRVLWSDDLELALTVETRSLSGATVRRCTAHVELPPPTERLPWLPVDRFSRASYATFGE